MILKGFFIALSLILLPEFLQAEDYAYTTNNGTITITGYAGAGGEVTLPSMITGLSVTRIGDNSFEDQEALIRLTIPSSVTSIGIEAFNSCGNLTGVSIPNSVTNIGHHAFNLCTSLTNIVIPNGLTSIPEHMCGNCFSLLDVTIPDSVKNIEGGAFAACTDLISITIPNSVTNIGIYAFSHCYDLTSIIIPSNVVSLGSMAFSDCKNLSVITVDVSNPMYSSLDGVLFNKDGTSLIRCPAGKSGNYHVPSGTTDIEVRAFDRCKNISSITIPISVTSIGARAFSDCVNLESGYFMGNAPDLGLSVFDGTPDVSVYYMLGTVGWGAMFGGRPIFLWNPQIQVGDNSFGMSSDGFGFNISSTNEFAVVVEASDSLADGVWVPVATNVMTEPPYYFSDPQSTNYPQRFYRLIMP